MMVAALKRYTGVGRQDAIRGIVLLVCLIPLATAQLVGPGALVMGGGGRGGSASFGSHSFNIHEAPVGFFVDGSSITAMNGVYGPKVHPFMNAVRMPRVTPPPPATVVHGRHDHLLSPRPKHPLQPSSR